MSDKIKAGFMLYPVDIKATGLHVAGLAGFVLISLVDLPVALFCSLSLLVTAFIVINYFHWLKNRQKRTSLKKVFGGSEPWYSVIVLGLLVLWYMPYYPTCVKAKGSKEKVAAFVEKYFSEVVHQPFQEMPAENVFLIDEDPTVRANSEVRSLNGTVIPVEWGPLQIRTFYPGSNGFNLAPKELEIIDVKGQGAIRGSYNSFDSSQEIQFKIKIKNVFRPGQIKDFVVLTGFAAIKAKYPFYQGSGFTVVDSQVMTKDVSFAIVDGEYRERLIELRQMQNKDSKEGAGTLFAVIVIFVNIALTVTYLIKGGQINSEEILGQPDHAAK